MKGKKTFFPESPAKSKIAPEIVIAYVSGK
jgi:hypothetical protein